MLTAFRRRGSLITGLLNDIDGIRCQAPGGAFYVFANISDTAFTSHQFQDTALEEYGVACISGTSFGGFGEGYVRLSCANSDEAISEAIERLKKMVGARA
jgi:aspartate/methionine/tyrosine aminotransferase